MTTFIATLKSFDRNKRTHSYENDFDLHENGREGGTHFLINGFARGLVLKQRQRVNVLLNVSISF